MMLKQAIVALGFLLAFGAVAAPPAFHVIPRPQQLTPGQGVFVLDDTATVAAPDDARGRQIAAFLRRAVAGQTGVHLHDAPAATATIVLRIDPAVHGGEAYRLRVTPQRIEIAAADDKGLFWGVETLRQLLPVGQHARVAVPAVSIVDAPRYPWRGVMLDVVRHFQPISFIKQQIDLMAYYKFNVLHWHLTDDQGWRIQIRKYPRLTSVGAWRTEADGRRYGGFYTQAQIRDVVAYAKARNIRVVPEIEMPGHASAAIAAYPALSCSREQIRVPTTWGVFRHVDCVDGQTFTFLENVLDEVMALFPSPYIHIGGDEVPQGVWADCAPCKKLHGVHGEAQIHGYFINRIRDYLARHDRTLVGWDEILEGQLNPRAVVEIWRGPDEAAKAIANGNRILVAGPFYLDAPIGRRTLQDLYRNDPFTNPVIAAHPRQVLGGEAPLWSEHVQSAANAQAKLWPRLFAVSEHLWNPAAHDVADFLRRVQAQYPWLEARHVAYGPANQDIVDYSMSFDPAYHRWRLRAQRGFDDLRIHYTTDGSTPTPASSSFGNVLDLYAPTTITVAPFRHGVRYEVPRTFHVVSSLALDKPVTYATPPSATYSGGPLQLVNGLLGTTSYDDGAWAGWQGADMDATVDLGKPTALHSIKVEFLQSAGDWILWPATLRIQVSGDGKTWTTVHAASVADDTAVQRQAIRDLGVTLAKPVTARHVRIVATPRAMSDPEKTSFIFAGEILLH